jgi:hypothetical protein
VGPHVCEWPGLHLTSLRPCTYRLCRDESLRHNHRDSPARRHTGTGWRYRFRRQDIWTVRKGDTRHLQRRMQNLHQRSVIILCYSVVNYRHSAICTSVSHFRFIISVNKMRCRWLWWMVQSLNSMKQRHSREVNRHSDIQEMFRLLWEVYYHVDMSLPLVPILSEMNPNHNLHS